MPLAQTNRVGIIGRRLRADGLQQADETRASALGATLVERAISVGSVRSIVAFAVTGVFVPAASVSVTLKVTIRSARARG